ncbi:L,D-transpeptidase [Pseudoxanthomonas dokdonensis]|uniref:ErfK-YbiS-YcfS-YnhG family protein n=1 Tax=Pseudoxanthomonas dokdonensis TaxID=344882 RepID=A0A0R0CT43_9GAMM|nr:L,D-transpeptidase [Pseudoxanthomonas dokdonensis]KRG69070.1 ErfK-YbiS-YcfS-YnhG family protein [Pseudoxanthomonas dokdonensis]
MRRLARLSSVLLGVLLGVGMAGNAAAVPFWGAKQSSPVDTHASELKPGEWFWAGDDKQAGPMAVVVSLTEQRAYVYRNGILIAVSTVSTGKPGHETPTGVFTILQKDKDHHSSIYNSAPMPYQQRLTWGGVALHAGGLPGYPESHGCVHLPTAFAQHLFEASNMGMTVVVAEEGSAPVNVVHPGLVSPINPDTGADVVIPLLEDGTAWRWDGDSADPVVLAADGGVVSTSASTSAAPAAPTAAQGKPATAKEGPISMVLSRSDRILFVYRNGVEVGRSRIALRGAPTRMGTHAYIVSAGFQPPAAGSDMRQARMPEWIAIGIPGREGEQGVPVPTAESSQFDIPPGFIAKVLPLVRPGTVLVATDGQIMPQSTGPQLQVINADPPPGHDPATR